MNFHTRPVWASLLVIVLLVMAPAVQACTNLLITCGASLSGSVMICYTCDAPFASKLHFLPGGKHEPGENVSYPDMRVRGVTVKQVPQTYGVLLSNGIGHMNEHQLAIGETTFGGRRGLNDKTGLHYADLLTITLQRAKTAREAIKTIAALAAQYGYHQSGESISIGDTKEAWIMEIIGNGKNKKGIVYVAVRVPDGFVSCHANQARIGEFPRDDPDNCMYSPDVEEVAIENGFFDPNSGKPFHFADAYHPVSARTQKVCAMRVWSLLNRAKPSLKLSSDNHRGVEGADRYPLWVKPDEKLSTQDVFHLLRDHYEGTEFDMTQGVNAGKYCSPYLQGGERSISVKGTVFSIVTQSREHLPDPVGGVVWYSPDDTYFSCYTPLYCGTSAVPKPYTIADKRKFSWDSAWWTINFVANYANLRYDDMSSDIQKKQREIEDAFIAKQPEFEKNAIELYANNPAAGKRLLTQYTVESGEMVIKDWRQLGESLIVRYNDRR
jgi:dipeptidase